MTTLSSLLSDRLRTDPGQPLVTFYDEATGERVELSVTTWSNWVAKSSSLLVDALGLERGQSLRIDLPPHWLGTVFLGAAWNAGLVLTDASTDGGRPDAVVTGPDGVESWSTYGGQVLACALKPLGVRFSDPLPRGVHDVGVEIWGQPDAFLPWDPPTQEDLAVDLEGLRLTQGQMWEAAAASPARGRLLSEVNPASPPGLTSLTGPLVHGGSVVLVVNAGPERLTAIAATERAQPARSYPLNP
ncbi:TIGR03089 family protein [Nocardioides sp. Kera G14]|uniref:TIGR03089 family protein n=1 Tax=Nocardioides sp. Kera G14 TaxID=2884264 RepID=UPI001D105E5B|nr:TIGR03089 family protein [Nocardioides sp. Kera G14]UDY22753.1 TIGR03089 family protein [Nocardioides sp. Kera G14]